MTQEEKAKAYDEAIKKLRDFYRDYDTVSHLIDVKEELENLFPELAESEDERIRKSIHIYLDWLDGRKDYAPRGEYTIRDMIAWLEKQDQIFTKKDVDDAYLRGISDAKHEFEKQGEQKPTLLKWKYKKDRTPLLRDSIILNKYGCVTKSPSGALVSVVWIIDYDELSKLPKEEIEKQGEQKPAWSEEDDMMIEETLYFLREYQQSNRCKDESGMQNSVTCEKWLKSLKERINGKQ